MNGRERIFADPAIAQSPPVLVDVGASGGAHPTWRGIKHGSIGLGFEPDARGLEGPAVDQRGFRRWIWCDKLVVAEKGVAEVDFHRAASPFCSSTLPPDETALRPWAFAEMFTPQPAQRQPAITLMEALRQHGLAQPDWLKCDTQGTDLRIFLSLPPEVRARTLAVEFEPGIIDAYRGEDKLHQVLAAMEQEPFWLTGLEVQGTPRGSMPMLRRRLGDGLARRYPRFGPGAAGWANAIYLHNIDDTADLDRRAHMLLWLFATELGQPGFACEVAEAGTRRFGEPLFDELALESTRQMRRSVWRAMARRGWEKICGR